VNRASVRGFKRGSGAGPRRGKTGRAVPENEEGQDFQGTDQETGSIGKGSPGGSDGN